MAGTLVVSLAGCGRFWIPSIQEEFAVRRTRERYDLVAAGVLPGERVTEGVYDIDIGVVGPGIRADPTGTDGNGPFFSCSFTTDDPSRIKPGMYSYNPNHFTERIPGTFSPAAFHSEMDMGIFKPVEGSEVYQEIGGTINVYAFSDSEIRLSWAIEVEEFEALGVELIPTGKTTVVDGRYYGEYFAFGEAGGPEYNGFTVDGEFVPLGAAEMAHIDGGDEDSALIRLHIAGGDSGPGGHVFLDLPKGDTALVDPGRYDLAEPGSLIAYQSFDPSDRRPMEGSRVFRASLGYCDLYRSEDVWVDLVWSADVDIWTVKNGEIVDTGSSIPMTGVFSGPLLISKTPGTD